MHESSQKVLRQIGLTLGVSLAQHAYMALSIFVQDDNRMVLRVACAFCLNFQLRHEKVTEAKLRLFKCVLAESWDIPGMTVKSSVILSN